MIHPPSESERPGSASRSGEALVAGPHDPPSSASIGLARLVLEYDRTLVWPLTIVALLVVYRSNISLLLRRAESVNVAGAALKFGTGVSSGEADRKTGQAPDVWFSLTKAELPRADCVARAQGALKTDGFAGIAVNDGTTVYGYDHGYVGVIRCADSHRLALVAVSGPGSGIVAGRQARLLAAFEPGRP